MEIIQNIWNYALPIAGGITVSAIVIFVATIAIKTIINRAIAKIDIQRIEDRAVEQGVQKIRTVSFQQSIEPLVKSELRKVVEAVDERFSEQFIARLSELQAKYDKIIGVLEGIFAFYEKSSVIPAEKKQAVKEKLAEASETIAAAQTIIVDVKGADEEAANDKKRAKARVER